MALPSDVIAFSGYNAVWIAIARNATAAHVVWYPEVSHVTSLAQIANVAGLANATDPIPLESAASREIALRFRTRTRLASNSIRFAVEALSASIAFGATRVLSARLTFAGLFVASLAATVAIALYGAANEALVIDDSLVDQQRGFVSPTIVTVGGVLARCAIVCDRASAHFNANGYVIRRAGQKDARVQRHVGQTENRHKWKRLENRSQNALMAGYAHITRVNATDVVPRMNMFFTFCSAAMKISRFTSCSPMDVLRRQ